MSHMEPWISKNVKEEALNDLSQKELMLVLHELQVNRISVTGCGVFSMTYSLAGQVIFVLSMRALSFVYL